MKLHGKTLTWLQKYHIEIFGKEFYNKLNIINKYIDEWHNLQSQVKFLEDEVHVYVHLSKFSQFSFMEKWLYLFCITCLWKKTNLCKFFDVKHLKYSILTVEFTYDIWIKKRWERLAIPEYFNSGVYLWHLDKKKVGEVGHTWIF